MTGTVSVSPFPSVAVSFFRVFLYFQVQDTAEYSPAEADKRVWTVRTLTAVYHRARCQVDGVVVRSCSVRKPFEARAMNAQLRAARADLPPGTSAEERVRAMTHALTKVGATEVGGARRAPRTPTFAVVIDARRWIGKSLTSPTTTSIEEALAWRHRG